MDVRVVPCDRDPEAHQEVLVVDHRIGLAIDGARNDLRVARRRTTGAPRVQTVGRLTRGVVAAPAAMFVDPPPP